MFWLCLLEVPSQADTLSKGSSSTEIAVNKHTDSQAQTSAVAKATDESSDVDPNCPPERRQEFAVPELPLLSTRTTATQKKSSE